METKVARPTEPQHTVRSATAPAGWPLIVSERAEPTEPTCECPEYCLLDHSN